MTPTKRQAQKEVTRQRIMETAFHLYAIKGFSTPTKLIAQEAKVSHGAIFVHFPTKEILQLQVLEEFTHKIGDKLHSLSTKGSSICELLHGHIDILQEYEHFYTRLITETSSLPVETKNMLIYLQSIMSIHFNTAIEQGQQMGTVKNIPLHMLFNTWLSLVHYYLQNADLFAPGKSVLQHRRNELIDSFIALISQ